MDMKSVANVFYISGLLSIPLSIILWLQNRNGDKPTAERWGIFIGLWVPSFFVCGKVAEDRAFRNAKDIVL